MHRPELVQRIPLPFKTKRSIVSWVTNIRMMEPRTVETEFKGEKIIIIIRNLLDHDDPVLNLEILIDLRSLFIDRLDKRVEGGLTGCGV
jgi:hypothetical protein